MTLLYLRHGIGRKADVQHPFLTSEGMELAIVRLPVAAAIERADEIGPEPRTGFAHPADTTRRYASHQRECGYAARYYGAGSDERILA